jgi:hypothetical protein
VLTQSSAGQNAGLPATDLELVNYGRGHAWLRRELDAAIADAEQLDQDLTRTLGWPASRSICTEPSSAGPHYRTALCPDPQPEERRVALRQRGRDLLARWRAERWLFGREVSAA